MTSRERLLAAARGDAVDRKPMIVWPNDEMYSDAAIVAIGRLGNAKASPRCVLAEIFSPFSRAIAKQMELNSAFKVDPTGAETVLRDLVEQTEREIAIALSNGADGIFYRLQGAEPEFSTPMEYGGHYLESDREILKQSESASLNVLCIEGGPEVYMDFVSDLPAHVFAWDSLRTHISVGEVRKMRAGILAAASPDADILFGGSYGLLQDMTKTVEVAS